MTTHQKTAIQTDQQAQPAFGQAASPAQPIVWTALEKAQIEADARREATGNSALVKAMEHRL